MVSTASSSSSAYLVRLLALLELGGTGQQQPGGIVRAFSPTAQWQHHRRRHRPQSLCILYNYAPTKASWKEKPASKSPDSTPSSLPSKKKTGESNRNDSSKMSTTSATSSSYFADQIPFGFEAKGNKFVPRLDKTRLPPAPSSIPPKPPPTLWQAVAQIAGLLCFGLLYASAIPILFQNVGQQQPPASGPTTLLERMQAAVPDPSRLSLPSLSIRTPERLAQLNGLSPPPADPASWWEYFQRGWSARQQQFNQVLQRKQSTPSRSSTSSPRWDQQRWNSRREQQANDASRSSSYQNAAQSDDDDLLDAPPMVDPVTKARLASQRAYQNELREQAAENKAAAASSQKTAEKEFAKNRNYKSMAEDTITEKNDEASQIPNTSKPQTSSTDADDDFDIPWGSYGSDWAESVQKMPSL